MIKFSTVADSLQTIYNRLRNGVCFGGHFLFSELSRANCENACNDQRHLLCTTVALAVNNQIYQRSKSCCLNRWFRVYKRAVAATVFMFATLFISWFSTRRQPLRTTNPYKSRSAPMNTGTLITAPRSKYLPIWSHWSVLINYRRVVSGLVKASWTMCVLLISHACIAVVMSYAYCLARVSLKRSFNFFNHSLH